MLRNCTTLVLLILITTGCAAGNPLVTSECGIKPVEAIITKKDGKDLRGFIRVLSGGKRWRIQNSEGTFIVPAAEVEGILVLTDS